MMCEILCRVLNTLAIHSEVHGYEYTIFAYRLLITTRTSLITFRHFRQIKEEKTYLKLDHCCLLLHFFLQFIMSQTLSRSQLGLSYWQSC